MVALSYGITYIWGTVGIILLCKYLPRWWGVDAKAAAKQVVGKGKIMAAYAAIDKSLSENMTILEALNSVSSDGVIKSNIRLTFFEMVGAAKAAKPEESVGVAALDEKLDASISVPITEPEPDAPTVVMPATTLPDDSAAPSEPATPKAKKKSKKGKKKSAKSNQSNPGWFKRIHNSLVGS